MSNNRDLAEKLLREGKIKDWELEAAAKALSGSGLTHYLGLRKRGVPHKGAMKASRG